MGTFSFFTPNGFDSNSVLISVSAVDLLKISILLIEETTEFFLSWSYQ